LEKNSPKKQQPKKSNLRNNKNPDKGYAKSRYFDFFSLGIIIILGIIIYSNTLNSSFHFDDSTSIVNNPSIQKLSDVKAWWNFSPSRPVSMFSFALNYHFGQLNVRGYHIVNLLIHLINACLVWWLSILIFSSPVLKDKEFSRNKKIFAFFTAILFVSHPLATQSVTYIIQRQTSMAAMFFMLSLNLYAYARIADKNTKQKILLFSGAVVSALLALLTKENAFMLPFIVLLFEICFITTKKFSLNFRDYRVIIIIAALLAMVVIIPMKLSLNIFDPILPSSTHGSPCVITAQNYLFTQFSVIVKYIQLLIFPLNQNLDYDFPVSNSFFDIRTVLSFIFLLFLLALGIFLYKKQRIISFGIFWFFLTLFIESSFIPIHDVIYEHRTYLPSVGYFLILSVVIFILLWKKYKNFAIIIFVVLIGANSILAFNRNQVWKNELTLWSDVVLKSPNKARPFANRGTVYDEMGQQDKAIADYTQALKIDSNYALAYSNRGLIYGSRGDYDPAIIDFSRALKIDSNNTFALWNRGITYSILKQWDDAIIDYSRLIEVNPKKFDPYFNRGVAYENLKKWDLAIKDYTLAISQNPKHVKAYNNRGIIYYYMGLMDKALADYNKAIEMDPDFKEAYDNRSVVYRVLNNPNHK